MRKLERLTRFAKIRELRKKNSRIARRPERLFIDPHVVQTLAVLQGKYI